MNFQRRGSETGSAFQDLVNRTNEAYQRAGRACITRKAIPGKYMIDRGESRRGLSIPSADFVTAGSGQARLSASDLTRAVKESKASSWRKFIPESKAEPDYGGVLAPSGRGIYFDAKSTRRDALDFDNLHQHQIDFLESTAQFGAVAGFLIEFSAQGEIYFLPIQVLKRWRAESTRKSLPYEFFVEHLTPAPAGQGMVLFDYLDAIKAQEGQYGPQFAEVALSYTRPRALAAH